MKLSALKDNCFFLRLFTSQNWLESIEFNISKTIWFQKMRIHFFKDYDKKHYIQNYKTKCDQFLSWSS